MESHQSCLRIHNTLTGAIINLVFEGNLRKLTGAQLREYLEKICFIPASQQILTFNGFPVKDTSTGATLGLHDKAMLELRTSDDSDGDKKETRNQNSKKKKTHSTTSYADDELRQGTKNAEFFEEHLNHSSRSEALRSGDIFFDSQRTLQGEQKRYKDGGEGYTQCTPTPNNVYSGLTSKSPIYTVFPLEGEPSNRLTEPVDIVVQEEIIDDLNEAAIVSLYDVDLEELHLAEREHRWLMDQMQFETERMCRERELMQERRQLEMEANELERERYIVGQRILLERRRLDELEQWTREEMELEGCFLNNLGNGAGAHDDINSYDTVIELVQKN